MHHANRECFHASTYMRNYVYHFDPVMYRAHPLVTDCACVAAVINIWHVSLNVLRVRTVFCIL